MINSNNQYTAMQKNAYSGGTSNHLNHNDNPDYWEILLGPLKDKERWKTKNALDFACGKGRNVTNLVKLCDWNKVDGVDISVSNISYCKENYNNQTSSWYLNNGVDLSDMKSSDYDFVMSTIALQHIPVHDIRTSLITDILRVMVPGGTFSFQMGFGKELSERVSGYRENSYSVPGTNSVHDVRVTDESEVVSDLLKIGFSSVECCVRNSFSDDGHPSWIYVLAKK